MSKELNQALKDLQATFDERIELVGGYPVEIGLAGARDECIVIADIESYSGRPSLSILDTAKYLEVWREAKIAFTAEPDGDLSLYDWLHELGFKERCLWRVAP